MTRIPSTSGVSSLPNDGAKLLENQRTCLRNSVRSFVLYVHMSGHFELALR